MEKPTLKHILDGGENVDEDLQTVNEVDLDETPVDPSLCIECQDMKTEIICDDCDEPFCVVCCELIHRSGKRKNHKLTKLSSEEVVEKKETTAEPEEIEVDAPENVSRSAQDDKILASVKAKVEFIPMRLTHEERHLLRLLEAALKVSEYTDRVDIWSYTSKAKRIVAQLKEMCSVLAGLVVASDLKKGQALLDDKTFVDNAEWYQAIFEIGRRYKIMNPERMRDTFGKLCYMVMDSRLPEIAGHMEFDLYKPIKTVKAFLDSKGDGGKAMGMFDDHLLIYATAEILPQGRTRMQIQRLIRTKEDSIEKLASKYSSENVSKEEIRQVLYSIGDYNAYTHVNRKPILRMLERLEPFATEEVRSKYSIGIQFGRSGARLTHDHDRQFMYVKQSLMLWSLIQRDMIKLWSIADDDLFNGSTYTLSSTGQGLNRVKACPALYRTMNQIIHECRSQSDAWVGSSVVHLGDDAVPNALFFLDKYTQIPNILIPFDQTLLTMKELPDDVAKWISDSYGSVEECEMTILRDMWAHMFDGSGSDNFYMSGSCIDGRLTSAWNFCNDLAKRRYYSVFLVTGFIGFNGNEGF